ncbi:uncharacterized protein LOC107681684 [Sinocyclocheilus anshuiensis]|uniref:uncharacterized protein LOC107681684 n=1 Tax=Sinocyclocheilus anshuiensis TaxID=1608454 RepID=UPI0007B966AC|nr:PREDICTED: uncharacterized protein LOC107681684 [Sinocyclocheilus anshuiensis]
MIGYLGTIAYKRHLKQGSFIQVYAPTEEANDAEKEEFYDVLQAVIDEIPRHDLKIVIGDMNAQFSHDRQGFEDITGPFASSKRLSDNGERLLSFCTYNNLCVGNTFFQNKLFHKMTWRSPNGLTFNEIDHVCISRRWRTALRDVRVFSAADVGSDHYLVRINLKLKLQRHEGRSETVRPFAIEKFKDQNIADVFTLQLSNRFQALADVTEIESKWQGFKETLTTCAQQGIVQRRGRRKEEWIKDRSWALIDLRKKAKKKRDQAQEVEDKETASRTYADLDRAMKQSCRRDKKDWLEKKCKEAQVAADRNDTRTLSLKTYQEPGVVPLFQLKTRMEITSSLHEEATKVGLHISAKKSKVMHIGAQVDMPRIKIDGSDIEEVSRFTYLGSTSGQDGDAEIDVKCRIGKATSVFQQMCKTWSPTSISLNIKLRFYTTIILPMATYAAETWKASARISHKVDVFHQRCLTVSSSQR